MYKGPMDKAKGGRIEGGMWGLGGGVRESGGGGRMGTTVRKQ